jgi:hypothetical protein
MPLQNEHPDERQQQYAGGRQRQRGQNFLEREEQGLCSVASEVVPAERSELPTNGLQIGRDTNRAEPVSMHGHCERLFCLKIL